jgi:hypothetical protein
MEHHLAQVNLAYMRAPQHDPLLGRKGPCPAVFSFKQAYTPQGTAVER